MSITLSKTISAKDAVLKHAVRKPRFKKGDIVITERGFGPIQNECIWYNLEYGWAHQVRIRAGWRIGNMDVVYDMEIEKLNFA